MALSQRSASSISLNLAVALTPNPKLNLPSDYAAGTRPGSVPVRADIALDTSRATSFALLLIHVSRSVAHDRVRVRVELEEQEPEIPAAEPGIRQIRAFTVTAEVTAHQHQLTFPQRDIGMHSVENHTE